MKSCVLRERHDLKVRGYVVLLVLVSMMHNLLVRQRPAEMRSHHLPMDEDAVARSVVGDVDEE